MKQIADKYRTERVFQEGDWVFLKLQPYRQETVAIRKNLTLATKFFGTFQIIAKVGAVAYKLKLLEGARIHPVFHISLLKKKVGVMQSEEPTLPEMNATDQCLLKPEKVPRRRVIMRNTQPIIQYLVKWSDLPES